MAHVSIIGTGNTGRAITGGGLQAVDAGGLSRARELEAVGFLQLTLAVAEKVSWTGGFGVAP